MPDIRAALLSKMPPSKSVKDLLVANSLMTPEGEPTELGEKVARILERVEGLPPGRAGRCSINIGKHHHRDRLKRFAQELAGRFQFVTEIHSAAWQPGQPKVKSEPPNLIRVFEPLRTEIQLQLVLVTTATTEGQLKAAERAVRAYLER